MAVKKDDKQKAFLEAMEKTFGNITKSCKMVGIHRTLPYKWAEDDKEFEEKFKSNQYGEMYLDFIEEKLTKLAQEDNPTAIIFLAKTKAKSRGYVERQEIDHSTKGFKIEFSKDVNNLAGLSPSKTKGDTTKQKKI